MVSTSHSQNVSKTPDGFQKTFPDLSISIGICSLLSTDNSFTLKLFNKIHLWRGPTYVYVHVCIFDVALHVYMYMYASLTWPYICICTCMHLWRSPYAGPRERYTYVHIVAYNS
jgi:hypothetical protein